MVVLPDHGFSVNKRQAGWYGGRYTGLCVLQEYRWLSKSRSPCC